MIAENKFQEIMEKLKKEVHEQKEQERIKAESPNVENQINKKDENLKQKEVLVESINVIEEIEEKNANRNIALVKQLGPDNNKIIIAVNAEGLDIAEQSAIGSRFAAEELIKQLENQYMKDLIIEEKDVETSMLCTWSALNMGYAQSKGKSFVCFATALSVAVYNVEEQELIYASTGKTNLITMDNTGDICHHESTDEENDLQQSFASFTNTTTGSLSNVSAFSMVSKNLMKKKYSEDFFERILYDEKLAEEINKESENTSFIRVVNQDRLLSEEEFFSNGKTVKKSVDSFGMSLKKNKINRDKSNY